MTRPNKHRLTCDIDLDIIQGLDSIVEQDRRYWHRTHLINEALRSFMDQWEEDREDDPYEDASDEDDDEDDEEDDEEDEEDDQGDQGDLFVFNPVLAQLGGLGRYQDAFGERNE